LDYKTSGALELDEAYSSQTCPVCGERNTCRRVYRCRRCGFTAPRDVVGSSNILCLGQHGRFVPGCRVPNTLHYVHPLKYPGLKPGSTCGHHGTRLGPSQEAPARLPCS
jgi:predicted RNA-binding Zn-ribbon protein involved in translation (DUF1610 family)